VCRGLSGAKLYGSGQAGKGKRGNSTNYMKYFAPREADKKFTELKLLMILDGTVAPILFTKRQYFY